MATTPNPQDLANRIQTEATNALKLVYQGLPGRCADEIFTHIAGNVFEQLGKKDGLTLKGAFESIAGLTKVFTSPLDVDEEAYNTAKHVMQQQFGLPLDIVAPIMSGQEYQAIPLSYNGHGGEPRQEVLIIHQGEMFILDDGQSSTPNLNFQDRIANGIIRSFTIDELNGYINDPQNTEVQFGKAETITDQATLDHIKPMIESATRPKEASETLAGELVNTIADKIGSYAEAEEELQHGKSETEQGEAQKADAPKPDTKPTGKKEKGPGFFKQIADTLASPDTAKALKAVDVGLKSAAKAGEALVSAQTKGKPGGLQALTACLVACTALATGFVAVAQVYHPPQRDPKDARGEGSREDRRNNSGTDASSNNTELNKHRPNTNEDMRPAFNIVEEARQQQATL
jgi:hypothetical protein